VKPLSRRSVIAGTAAVVTAIPAAGFAADAKCLGTAELFELIEAHRVAYQAFGVAIDREQAAKELLLKGEPTVDSGLGEHFSLYPGEDQCRRLIANKYQNARRDLKRLRRMDQVAPQAEAIVDAKEAEAMAAIDRAFADYNAAAANCSDARDAEADGLTALCSYRCRTGEEASIKAEYLLTAGMVRDTWNEDAKALLESFARPRRLRPESVRSERESDV
jgi:hypothetical protein